MTGAFFLGICINYPNGLFNSSLFQVWPWAEDFPSIFGCSVECMHSYSPCSLWYVLECCCYCTFFEVQYFVIAIVVWTCLTVFFLGICSKYYIVTSCGYFRWSDPNVVWTIMLPVFMFRTKCSRNWKQTKKRQKQVSQVLRSLHVSLKSASHTARVYISWHLDGSPRSRHFWSRLRSDQNDCFIKNKPEKAVRNRMQEMHTDRAAFV